MHGNNIAENWLTLSFNEYSIRIESNRRDGNCELIIIKSKLLDIFAVLREVEKHNKINWNWLFFWFQCIMASVAQFDQFPTKFIRILLQQLTIYQMERSGQIFMYIISLHAICVILYMYCTVLCIQLLTRSYYRYYYGLENAHACHTYASTCEMCVQFMSIPGAWIKKKTKRGIEPMIRVAFSNWPNFSFIFKQL